MSAGWMPGIVDPIYIQSTIQYSQHSNAASSIATLKGILAETMVESRMIANFLEGDNMLEESPTRLTATLYHTRYTNCCQPQERHNRSPKSLPTYVHDTLTESSKGLQGLRSLIREEQGCVRRKYKSNTNLSYSRMYLNSFDLVISYSPVSQRVLYRIYSP